MASLVATRGVARLQVQQPAQRCAACAKAPFRAAWATAQPLSQRHSRRSHLLRATEVEEVEAVAEVEAEPEAEAASPVAEEPEVEVAGQSAWATEQLALLEEEETEASVAVYSLNFLWLEKNIGVSIDQIFNGAQRSPLTEYFFWPRKDAWEELKTSLEAKDWISDRERVLLLNKTTEVINFWQDEGEKHTVEEARQKFDNCHFEGS